MAFDFGPHSREPLPGERRARAAEIAEDWRIAREGVEIIAHGALICPDCQAPAVVDASVPVGRWMECGFCGHSDRARAFLVRDVFDTVANEAYMVASLPA